MMVKTKYVLLLGLLLNISNLINAQWEKVKMPGIPGGAVFSVCIKESLLFAAKQGGVYVSADDGETWAKVNPDLPPREYNAIATSLALCGEKVIAAFNEPGVYLSSDDGISWTQAEIDALLRGTPTFISADGDWIIGVSYQQGFQSRNKGLSWEPMNLGHLTTADIQDSIALVYDNNRIMRSSDYGFSWNTVHLTPLSEPFQCSVVISGNKAFCGVAIRTYNNLGAYILSSTNRGLTWETDSIFIKCNSINSLVVSPDISTNNFIFAGTDSGVFRSSDDGNTWIPVNNGLTSGLIFSLAFRSSDAGIPVLYAGTGNGIFKSKDYGESWEAVGSPSSWFFAPVESVVYAASSNASYSGQYWGDIKQNPSYHNAVYYSPDNGNEWIKSFSGSLEKNSGISLLIVNRMQNNETLLASSVYSPNPNIPYGGFHQGTLLFSSNDKGATWRKLNFDSTYVIAKMEAHNSTIFSNSIQGGNIEGLQIQSSNDNGNNWITYSDPLRLLLRDFAFDDDKIYAGGGDRYAFAGRPPVVKQINSILLSSDNGLTWTKIPSPLDSGTVIKNQQTDTVSTLTSLYAKGSHLFAGMAAGNFYQPFFSYRVANGGILYHLIRNSEDWSVANTSFAGTSVFAIESNDNDIFAATDSGVFRSNDYGSTWSDISLGMKNIYVPSLFKTGNYLFANTINGIWKRHLSEITSAERSSGNKFPRHFHLAQNYPNPFNPATKIEFQIPEFSRVILKIFDILGREVRTLVDEEKAPGNYLTSFNAEGLSSGIYMYQLKAGRYTDAKKFILLR